MKSFHLTHNCCELFTFAKHSQKNITLYENFLVEVHLEIRMKQPKILPGLVQYLQLSLIVFNSHVQHILVRYWYIKPLNWYCLCFHHPTILLKNNHAYHLCQIINILLHSPKIYNTTWITSLLNSAAPSCFLYLCLWWNIPIM